MNKRRDLAKALAVDAQRKERIEEGLGRKKAG